MTLVRKFASVGAATMASRILGFIREAMIAALLGAGPVADAFYAAFRFPNLFRRLFAEGAFNAAFIPLFASELEVGGRQAARDFAEKVLSVLILVLIMLSALALVFMPVLVSTVIAPSFVADGEKYDLTVLLARIMFPYLAAMSLVAMLSGILNAFRHYFLAALAPVLLNIVLICVLALALINGFSASQIGLAMAIGVTFSGLVQLALLMFAIRRLGFPLTLRLPGLSPGVKNLLALALPTALAGGITQINLLVGQMIASAQGGAIAMINYADRLMQLPLGIVGISIGVVLLPELSRALADKDHKQALHLQNRSLEFGLGLAVPAAVGLFMIPEPLVALVFERGAFNRDITVTTAMVLAAFSIGLPSFVLIKILQPAFYARQDMKTPMWFAAANAIINIVLSVVLFPRLGVSGLALATSLAGWANAILLFAALRVTGKLETDRVLARNLFFILLASATMAALLWFAGETFEKELLEEGVLVRLVSTLALVGVSALVYFVIVLGSGAMSRQRLLAMMGRY